MLDSISCRWISAKNFGTSHKRVCQSWFGGIEFIVHLSYAKLDSTLKRTNLRVEKLHTNLLLNRVADFFGPRFQRFRVAAFHEQAHFRFRAGVTQ